MPGNRLIEGRFRSVIANCASSRSISKALADVERTGRFLGDEIEVGGGLDRDQIRPGLVELAGRDDVHVAFFLRGNTALVQGAQGAAADRSARAVRDVVSVTEALLASCCSVPLGAALRGKRRLAVPQGGRERDGSGLGSADPHGEVQPADGRACAGPTAGGSGVMRDVLDSVIGQPGVRVAAIFSNDGLALCILEADTATGAWLDIFMRGAFGRGGA